MRFKGKVAVVTGAAKGIGLACARRLAKEGADLVIADRDPDAGRIALETLCSPGRRVRLVIGDVGYKDDVTRVFETAVREFGTVDILVANAGIYTSANFLDVTEEDYDAVIRTNLKSVFLCGQAAAKLMVNQRRGGSIVNMSSVNAVMVNADAVPYAMSKGGVNQLTKAMAIALSPYGIRVNALGPGTILTDLARKAALRDPSALSRILDRTPLGRLGTPEEVASVAVFLASDDASYMTGQTVYLDGGRLGLNYTVSR